MDINMIMALRFIALGMALLTTSVSGQCTLCFQDATPTVTSDNCTALALEAGTIPTTTQNECIDLQVKAWDECGCPPVSMPQEACELCGTGVVLPFPDRVVYIEGLAEPTTCAALEQTASESRQLCDEATLRYQFYCGCPGVNPSCSLCPKGDLTPVPELILKGYAPEWFPDVAQFTCGEMERQRSLVNETACLETDVEIEAQLCGCFVPAENVNCTTVCPDNTLMDPTFWDNSALVNQPFWGNMSCREYEFSAASGYFRTADCDDANYVGIKRCGCAETRPFCDICEDGTEVENLEQEVTFQKTCLTYAGSAYSFDPQADICNAFQSTAGIYCGCNNPIASQGACRICDEPGGEVVNDPNLTIPVGRFVADCGELEFTGNDPTNAPGFTCQNMTDFGIQCCEFAPSNMPTSSPASTITASPTASSSTPPPTAVATPASTPDSTPATTPGSTPATTPASTLPPTLPPTLPTTLPTTLPPTLPPTPAPTQTASAPPSGSLQAAVYHLEWYGVTDDGDNCEDPTPGMLVTCGDGGQIDILYSTDTAACDFAGTGVICTGEIGDENDFWGILYGCIGSTATSWTTKVVAIPDTSVQCSSGGAAGTAILLGQRCPGADGDTNFNQVQCSPSDSFQTGQTSDINFCRTFSSCQDSTCTLSTPDVAAEIPESAISSFCLFAVPGGNTPQTQAPTTPAPTTPAPTTPAPTTPAPTFVNPEASVYQVLWSGVVFPEESCDEPTPGMRVFCGEGGQIQILDNTDTVQCSYIGDNDNEVSCTVTFDDTTLWALVYQCIGTTELSCTTNVEIVPDSSVQCSSGSITGSGLFLQQVCPGQDPDPNQVQCNPADARETSDTGAYFCRTLVACQGSSCVLGTPELGASIPVSAITDSCLWSP